MTLISPIVAVLFRCGSPARRLQEVLATPHNDLGQKIGRDARQQLSVFVRDLRDPPVSTPHRREKAKDSTDALGKLQSVLRTIPKIDMTYDSI